MRITKTIAAAVLAFSGFSAAAADMPLKAPLTRYADPSPTWAGFYLGANGGFNWLQQKTDMATLGTFNPDGGIIGGQAGYIGQAGSWVAGIETDFEVSTGKVAKLIQGVSVAAKVEDHGSTRVLAGYLVAPQVLLYSTVGLAWAKSQADIAAAGVTMQANPISFGWAAGGGVRYLVSQNVVLRAEFLHYDMGKTNFVFGGLAGTTAIPTAQKFDGARGGVDFKF